MTETVWAVQCIGLQKPDETLNVENGADYLDYFADINFPFDKPLG